MDDIRFYDYEFNLLHIAPRYLSSNWTLYYNDIGTFEAHFDVNSELTVLLHDNRYIVAVQGDKAAIITGVQIAENLAVFGRTCNWLLSKRVTPKFKLSLLLSEGKIEGNDDGEPDNDSDDYDTGKSNAETISRYLVSEAFSDVIESGLMSLSDDPAELTKQFYFWRNTLNPTFDVIKDCLNNDSAGHELKYDISRRKWVFRIYKGKELPLLISEINRNANDTEVSYDCLDYCSSGWYEFQPDFDEDSPEASIESEWIYVEKNASDEGIYKWIGKLSAQSNSEATDELKKLDCNNSIKANVYGLQCGIDYNLGDVVKVDIQKGLYKKREYKRIIGVNIWYEPNNEGQQPIFEDDTV